MLIHKRGTTAVSDIGEELGISNPAASQMIDRLVQDGLILRTEHPDDRRVKQIQLTDKGFELIQGSLEARRAWLHTLGEELLPEEKQQISQALKILIEKTQKIEIFPTEMQNPE